LTVAPEFLFDEAGISRPGDYLALLARVHAYARGVAPGLFIG
jgi:hypothetical protein